MGKTVNAYQKFNEIIFGILNNDKHLSFIILSKLQDNFTKQTTGKKAIGVVS